MKRAAAALLACAFAASPARAEEPDTLMRAVEDELSRTMTRLRMGELPRPYFTAYTVHDTHRFELVASFGALKDSGGFHQRSAKIDLRVGSRNFDNAHYVGPDHWNYPPESRSLVLDDDYDALRHDLWLLSDGAFKRALERLSQKLAYKQDRMIRDILPDLSEEPAASSRTRASRAPFRRKIWERRLRKLSKIFRDYPLIQNSQVGLYWTDQAVYFADSEGRRVIKPGNDYEIAITAGAQASDGMHLMEHRRFIRQAPDRLPPFALLETEVVKLAKSLTALAEAPKFDEEYIGPILFEDQAAGEFFNQLLARNISYAREVWVQNEGMRKQFPTGALTTRKGLRVLSPFLSVEDDPGLREFEGIPLIGHYTVDDEGIPARRVQLVEKGILRDLPAGRSPTKENPRSNGHGRSAFWEKPQARISNMIVWAEKTETLRAMKKDLLRRAAEFGLDHAYIARRMMTDEVRRADEFLAPPALLYRVDVGTGKETLVRNARFSGVTLRALRDIVAASHRRHVYNYYQLGANPLAQGQTQASIVHPSILVAEIELKRTDAKPVKLPYIKHPHFN